MFKGWGLGWIAALALALPAVARPSGLNSGFDLRVFGGGNYNGGGDLETDFNAPASSSLADYYGLGGDYGFQSGFVLGLDLVAGPNRRHTFGGSSAPFSGVIAVNNFGQFITPGWRVSPAKNLVVEARLGLGLLEATEAVQLDGIGNDSYSGIGYGVWPEMRCEYEVGSWGLGLSVGYLASMVDSVADSNGQILVGYNADNATLHTEGVSMALFGVYHFTPPLQ
jgi:hypothetical protein